MCAEVMPLISRWHVHIHGQKCILCRWRLPKILHWFWEDSWVQLVTFYLLLIIFYNTYATSSLIFHLNHSQEWILQHFPCLSGLACVDDYEEAFPRSCSFFTLEGNQTTESFWVYLNRNVGDDINFTPYGDHCERDPSMRYHSTLSG